MIIALILKINQPEVYKQLLTMLSTSVASEIAGIEYDPPPAADETKAFMYIKKLMEERRGVVL